MKTISFVLVRDKFDNKIVSRHVVDWEECVEIFTGEHLIEEDKNCMLVIFAEFLEAKDPVMRPAEKHIFEDKQLKDIIYYPDVVGRYRDNVVSYSGLTLDYDGGVGLLDIHKRLEDLEHLGWTSHSHLHDGRTEKFRIFLPFEVPCPRGEWELRKEEFLKIAGEHVDERSVDVARPFHVASCPKDRLHLACRWNNEGILLDWRELEAKQSIIYETTEKIQIDQLTKVGAGRIIYKTFDMINFFKDNNLYITFIGGSKHNIICPNYLNHTNQIKSGTYMYQDGIDWPHFHCAHSHCKHLNGKGFYSYYKELLGSRWMDRYCLREKEITIKDLADKIKRPDT